MTNNQRVDPTDQLLLFFMISQCFVVWTKNPPKKKQKSINCDRHPVSRMKKHMFTHGCVCQNLQSQNHMCFMIFFAFRCAVFPWFGYHHIWYFKWSFPKNRDTPKSSKSWDHDLILKAIVTWGTPISGNLHMDNSLTNRLLWNYRLWL